MLPILINIGLFKRTKQSLSRAILMCNDSSIVSISSVAPLGLTDESCWADAARSSASCEPRPPPPLVVFELIPFEVGGATVVLVVNLRWHSNFGVRLAYEEASKRMGMVKPTIKTFSFKH